VHVRAEAEPLKVISRRTYAPNLKYLFIVLMMIALASLASLIWPDWIWHGVVLFQRPVKRFMLLRSWGSGLSVTPYEQVSCLQHIVVVFRDVCGWLCVSLGQYHSTVGLTRI
jgi:hypothetical protein